MASTKLMQTKDGKRFYKISVSRGHGLTAYTERWYIPDGVTSKRAIEKALRDEVNKFEIACGNGEVLSRAEKKEKAAQEAAEAAEAARKAAEEAAKIKTVRQYATDVFMPAKEATLSENARASYQMFIDRHILPVLGDIALAEVKPAMITKLILDFQKAGYAHASAVKLYNVLNGIFDMAFMDDSIPFSPMLKVKRPAPRKDERVKNEADKSLTAEQLDYVLSCLEQEPLKWRAFVTLAADSGARRGEICALRWADIDWKSGTVRIKHNLQYTPTAGVYETSPKNGKVRVVDLGEDTIALLRELREEQAASCVSRYVFTQDGTAEPMFPQSPTRYFKKFGERYNVQGFHPHLLRHTSASLSLTNGADMKSTADRLGHSEAVLLRKYAHSNPDSIRKAGQASRDALKKAQNA